MAQKTYTIDMCSGAILPKMLRFSIPLMCSGLLQILFNTADIIVVGRFAGDNSLAAVGSTASLIHLLVNLFMGLSTGASILAARHFGAKENEDVHATIHTAMLLSLISGAVLALIGVLGAPAVLRLMKSPPDVLPLSILYLRIYFLGMPATMLYNFGAAILRSAGDTRRPLYYLSFAGIVNVTLNLIFVIVLHMDVAGVALATIISQAISAYFVVRCLTLETGAFHLDLHQLRVYPDKLRQILQIGIPAGLQGVLFSLSNVVIQSSINTFGETVVAGNSAASSVEAFLYVSVNAFHQANIAFTSQNYGGGHYRRIWRVFFLSTACSMVLGGILGGAVILTGPQLLGLYTTSVAVIAAGMTRLRITCMAYSIGSMMDTTVGTVRGLGYSILPTIVTLIGACVLRLVWLATVFQLPAYHNISTIYWSYPITWLLTALAHCICVFFIMKRVKRTLDPDF